MTRTIEVILLCLVANLCFAQQDDVHFEYLFKLHGQKRIIELDYHFSYGEIFVDWKLRKDSGQYLMTNDGLKTGSVMSFKRGEVGGVVELNSDETMYQLISQTTYQELLANNQFVYSQTTYKLIGEESFSVGKETLNTLHVKAEIDETEMWILKDAYLPTVVKMMNNPLGIDYTLQSLK